MRNPTVFETTIIGFFVGVVVSAYSAYSLSAHGVQGSILRGLSWGPVADMVSVPASQSLFLVFALSVVAYMVYGALFGILLKRGRKGAIIAACILFALVIGGIIEQRAAILRMPPAREDLSSVVSYIPDIHSQQTKPAGRYFGTEAYGDLNNDGKDDIAFLISRDDDDRGRLYYLVAALMTDEGHTGTNLVFLGDKVKPLALTIHDQIISIEYTGGLLKHSTSTANAIQAHLVSGKLVFVEQGSSEAQASTTVR